MKEAIESIIFIFIFNSTIFYGYYFSTQCKLNNHKYILRNYKTSKQTFHISQTQLHRSLDYDTFNILKSSNSAGTLALAPLVFNTTTYIIKI